MNIFYSSRGVVLLLFSAIGCVPTWDKLESVQVGGEIWEGMNPGECSDGADNDGDGSFDCNDSNCENSADCTENFAAGDCSDGEDGDQDGAIDCEDSDCDNSEECGSSEEEPASEPGQEPVEPSSEPSEEPASEPGFESGDPDNGLEIRLTWSMAGDDLDLHLIAPDVAWEEGWQTDDDCFYANCGAGGVVDWGVEGDSADNPVLLMDDIEGTGPEVIFIETPEVNGVYSVVVHDYQTPNTEGPNEVMIEVLTYGTALFEIEFELAGDGSCVMAAMIDMGVGTVTEGSGEAVECPGSGQGGGPPTGPN